MKVKLINVRLTFPAIFEAKAFDANDKNPAFSASFLLDPKNPAHAEKIKEISGAIDGVAKEKWGAKAAAILVELRGKDKVAIHDGNLKASTQGYEGMMYVSARSSVKPLVINADRTVLAPADGKPYGGCYVDASIEIYAQDNAYGKRINATLKGVQFRRDGDAFAGGAPASADDFDDLAVDEDADSLV